MKVGVTTILKTARQLYNLPPGHLSGRSRKNRDTYIRKVTILAARELTGASLTQIGARMNRDHTTILHLLRGGEELARKSHVFRGEVELLKRAANVLTPAITTCYNNHDVFEKGANDGETRLDR